MSSPEKNNYTYHIIGLNFSQSDLPLLEGRHMNLHTVHLMRRLPVIVLTGVKKKGSKYSVAELPHLGHMMPGGFQNESHNSLRTPDCEPMNDSPEERWL